MSGWNDLDKEPKKDEKAEEPSSALENAPAVEDTDSISQEEYDQKMQDDMVELMEHTCPKCSWDTRNKLLKAKEDDLREYTRCLLANRPFVKALPIFGNKLNVQFTENTDVVREEVMRLIKTMNESIESMTQLDLVTLTRKIQIVFSLTSLSIGEDKKTFELPPVNSLKDYKAAAVIFEERLGNKSASFQAILFRTYQEFDRLMQVMADGAFDENFYQGVGLD